MRAVGNLFDRIADRSNLITAVWAAAREKRDNKDVREFLAKIEDHINQIASSLINGRFEFQASISFSVQDTKTRLIQAPTFRDRVVHHAIINITGPIFERGALHHSYACRTGKGQHAALIQARAWTRRHLWYGKMDIRRYYDSVDHDLLRQRLERRFRERRLLNLFDRLLGSWSLEGGKGLPIGALTSQYLANFYLDAFDANMKASGECSRYMRYMDDIVVWAESSEMPSIRRLARESAAAQYLEIKHDGEWNQCRYGVPFLGFVIYPDRMRLGRQGRRRLRGKMRTLQRQFREERISELEYQSRCTSLFAHAQTPDDVNWRRTVLSCGHCPPGD